MKKLLKLLVCMILCFQNMQVMAETPFGTLDCMNNSNSDYIFKIKGSGQRFLLLDVFDDNDSKFFVMGIDYYGQGAFDEFGKQRLDVEQTGNVAYKLNKVLTGEGLVQSFTQKVYSLPSEIVDYIDFNHAWKTKGSGSSKGNAKNDYTTVCGVNLLSQEEFLKYISKIGAFDELLLKKYSPNGSGWWLRDGAPDGSNMLAVRSGDKPWINLWTASDTKLFYRPVFYVSKDFFGNVPIDLKSAGEGVKSIFKEYYTIGELKKIYKEADVYDYLDYKSDITVKVERFTNGKDSISKINNAELVCAEIIITNNQMSEQSGTIVMTYYDCNGRTKQIDSRRILISANETQAHKLSLNFSEVPEKDSYVKITFVEDKKSFQSNNSIRFYCE